MSRPANYEGLMCLINVLVAQYCSVITFQLYEHYTTEDDSPPVEYLHIPQLLGDSCLLYSCHWINSISLFF